jgi:hypothetical protein
MAQKNNKKLVNKDNWFGKYLLTDTNYGAMGENDVVCPEADWAIINAAGRTIPHSDNKLKLLLGLNLVHRTFITRSTFLLPVYGNTTIINSAVPKFLCLFQAWKMKRKSVKEVDDIRERTGTALFYGNRVTRQICIGHCYFRAYLDPVVENGDALHDNLHELTILFMKRFFLVI